MLSLFKVLVLPIILIIGLFFINENSPSVSIEILQRRITSTALILLVVMLLVLFVFYLVVRSIYTAITLPWNVKKRYKEKMEAGKFNSLVDLLIAFEQKNHKMINKSLSYLLSSGIPKHLEVFLIYKKNALRNLSVQNDLSEMIKYEETASLATMKLMEEQMRRGDYIGVIKNVQNIQAMPEDWMDCIKAKAYYNVEKWQECFDVLMQNNNLINFESKQFLTIYALTLIKLKRLNECVRFFAKYWREYADVLLHPVIVFLYENRSDTSYVKKIRKMMENDNSESSYALNLYIAVLHKDRATLDNLLHLYDDVDFAQRYRKLFAQYSQDVLSDSVFLQLFTEYLIYLCIANP